MREREREREERERQRERQRQRQSDRRQRDRQSDRRQRDRQTETETETEIALTPKMTARLRWFFIDLECFFQFRSTLQICLAKCPTYTLDIRGL